MGEPRRLLLHRVCREDDPNMAAAITDLIESCALVELPLPDPQPYPEGHDGLVPLPLPQFMAYLREKHGAQLRVFLKPADVRDFGTGPVAVHGTRTWLLLRFRGSVYYADATHFLAGMPGAPDRAPENY